MESLAHEREKIMAGTAPFAAAQPDCAWCFPFGEGKLVIGFSSSLAASGCMSMFPGL